MAINTSFHCLIHRTILVVIISFKGERDRLAAKLDSFGDIAAYVIADVAGSDYLRLVLLNNEMHLLCSWKGTITYEKKI